MHCSTLRSDFGLLVTLYSLAVEWSQDQITVTTYKFSGYSAFLVQHGSLQLC